MDDNARKNREEYFQLLNKITKKNDNPELKKDVVVEKTDTFEPVENVDETMELLSKQPEDVYEKKTLDITEIQQKAEIEGITLKVSRGTKEELKKLKTFNLSKTLFISATIIFFIILVEAIALILCRKIISLNINYIFALLYGDIAFLGLFAIMFLCKVGKDKKIRNNDYFMSLSIIIAILVFLTFVFIAVLRDIDFTTFYSILKNILIPLVLSINIPLFVIIYKSLKKKQTKKEA